MQRELQPYKDSVTQYILSIEHKDGMQRELQQYKDSVTQYIHTRSSAIDDFGARILLYYHYGTGQRHILR